MSTMELLHRLEMQILTENVWLKPEEAAAYLKLARKTLYNWRYRGIGPKTYKINGALRYRLKDLEEWAQSHMQDDETPKSDILPAALSTEPTANTESTANTVFSFDL